MKIPDILKNEWPGGVCEAVRWTYWSMRRYWSTGEEELAYFQLGPASTAPGWTNVITPGAMPGQLAFAATRLRGVPQGPTLGWLPYGVWQDLIGFSSMQLQVSDRIAWEGPARDVFTSGVELESVWLLPVRPYRVTQRWSQRVPLRGPAGWPMGLQDLLLMVMLDGWLVRRTAL